MIKLNSENINLIIKLLEDYVNEYWKLKKDYEDCEIKKQLFEQLEEFSQQGFQYLMENKLFVSALLDAIYYDDSTYCDLFYEALRSCEVTGDIESLTKFFEYLRSDKEENLKRMESIKKQIDNRCRKVKTVKTDISLLKRRRRLIYDYNIKQILSYYETKGIISSKELLLLNNELRYYNASLVNDAESDFKRKRYQEIPNILDSGFEIVTVDVHFGRRESLNNNTNKIINMLWNLKSPEQLIELLESHRGFYKEINEFRYVVNEVVKYYLNTVLDCYEFLFDPSIYQSAFVIEDAKEEYFNNLKYYLVVREYFNNLENVYDLDVEEEVTDEDVANDNKILVFSHSSIDPIKAKLISDLKAIEPEKYEELYDLLERFVHGKITKNEYKRLHSSENIKMGFSELKGDQVRIVLKHLRDNIYCVMGAFIKKSTRDDKNYNGQRARMVADISTKENEVREIELGNKTMEEVKKIVEKNSRKGSR